MNENNHGAGGHRLVGVSARSWVCIWMLGVALVLFVGVAWFLVFVAARRAFVVALMAQRAKAEPTLPKVVRVALGVVISSVFLALGLMAFAHGDVSLLGRNAVL